MSKFQLGKTKEIMHLANRFFLMFCNNGYNHWECNGFFFYYYKFFFTEGVSNVGVSTSEPQKKIFSTETWHVRKKKKWLVMERLFIFAMPQLRMKARRVRTASTTASSERSWLLATLTVNKSSTSLH